MDHGTVAILAVVLWLDGWRRASGAILLVRPGFGGWTVRAPWARVGAFALAGWWPPVVMPLVVPLPDGASSGVLTPGARWQGDFLTSVARARRRLRRERRAIAILRGAGVTIVVWIVLGIPAATAWLGAFGLLAGIAAAFALALPVALLTLRSLWSLGLRGAGAWGVVLPLLVPFSASRAPELVIGEALRGVAPLARVAALLGDARFLAWLRPWAFDALHGRAPRSAPDALLAGAARLLPRPLLERATRLTTLDDPDDGARVCPRCARTYDGGAGSCADCDDVPLAARAQAPPDRTHRDGASVVPGSNPSSRRR